MKNKAEDIKYYNFKSSDSLLLDTNIWFFIHGPQRPGNPIVDIYSQVLAKMLEVGSRIYINVLIVSEFINTYARLKWKLVAAHVDFKDFRKSADFKPVAREIVDSVKCVLQNSSKIEDSFEELAINNLLEEYAIGASDFNDQILTDLCKRKNLILITDDSDFKNQEIFIVTANKRLLY